MLRFTDPGNIDNDDEIGSIGYNYAVSKKDTIGVLYRFSAYHFPGLSQAIGDHVFNVAYGRKITGRLGLGLFAGPEIVTFRVPIGTKTEETNLSFGASLAYGFEWGGVHFTYNHGTNGGSGVLAGATGDNINANVTRRITRLWSARAKFWIWSRTRVRSYRIFRAVIQFLLSRSGVGSANRPQFASFFWLYRVYREYQSGRLWNHRMHCWRLLHPTPTCRWISMAYAAFRFTLRNFVRRCELTSRHREL